MLWCALFLASFDKDDLIQKLGPFDVRPIRSAFLLRLSSAMFVCACKISDEEKMTVRGVLNSCETAVTKFALSLLVLARAQR